MQVIVRIVEKMRTDLKCGTHETSSYPLGGAHQGFGVGEALEEAISAWRSIRRPPERPDIAASGRVRTNERTRQRTNKQTNKQTRRITIPPRGGINVGLRFLFFLLSVIRVIDQIRCRTRCTYTELSLSHNAALFIGRSRAITREFFYSSRYCCSPATDANLLLSGGDMPRFPSRIFRNRITVVGLFQLLRPERTRAHKTRRRLSIKLYRYLSAVAHVHPQNAQLSPDSTMPTSP